jgi:hypothetical protein
MPLSDHRRKRLLTSISQELLEILRELTHEDFTDDEDRRDCLKYLSCIANDVLIIAQNLEPPIPYGEL